jgi:plastocyanin
MRRRVAVPCVALLSAALVACGGGSSSEPPASSAPVTNPVDPATAGNVAGRVTFEGNPPAAARLPMDSDPNCAKQGNATDETVVIGQNNSVQNVFVYVKDGLGNLKFPVPSTVVILDQKGCRYTPHVLGAQVGQRVEIINSDPTLHNVHALAATNQEFNMGQPLPGMKHTHTFSAREVMVPFKCDVHSWMRAYVGVLDHPYFSVTGPDGSFSLKGLPPGTYTIEAWHEKLGTQTQSVTIGPTESREVAFAFKG